MEREMDPRAAAFWKRFLARLPADSPYRHRRHVAESWGDSPRLADELSALIVAGIKTATCSSVWEWEAEGEAVPEVGQLTIVLDGQGNPLCVVETVEVTLQPYHQVDARFAYDEGEGDRSLQYWRDAHWRYFSRTLATIGREPSDDMPLVCERFRVIYQE
jgi:uncharacterized protein YhfF